MSKKEKNLHNFNVGIVDNQVFIGKNLPSVILFQWHLKLFLKDGWRKKFRRAGSTYSTFHISTNREHGDSDLVLLWLWKEA